MTWRRVGLILGLALMASACAAPAEPGSDPTGIPWELESGTVDGAEVPLFDSHPITMTFTDDAVGGTAACNGYGGSYAISESGITFSDLFATEMACIPEAVMESERLYLGALPRVDSFSSARDTLTLSGEGVELVFRPLPPVPTAELTGAVWVLDSLIDGDAVSSAGGERATLELYTDGSMLGSTGCRALHGNYSISGAEVQMPEMAAEGECPADLQAQDGHVVSVLGDGFRVAIDGRALTLTSRGGLGLAYHVDE
jgi:heat shock protein HslJ